MHMERVRVGWILNVLLLLYISFINYTARKSDIPYIMAGLGSECFLHRLLSRSHALAYAVTSVTRRVSSSGPYIIQIVIDRHFFLSISSLALLPSMSSFNTIFLCLEMSIFFRFHHLQCSCNINIGTWSFRSREFAEEFTCFNIELMLKLSQQWREKSENFFLVRSVNNTWDSKNWLVFVI